MNIRNNPFNVLEVTSRDSKETIYAHYEQKILFGDPKTIEEAKEILLSPRKRIQAEITWFPSLSPQKILALLDDFYPLLNDGSILKAKAYIESSLLEPLEKCILLLELLEADLTNQLQDDLSSIILQFSLNLDKIDTSNLIYTINANRLISGFPEIGENFESTDTIEFFIENIKNCIAISLEKLPSMALVDVLNTITQITTNKGTILAPVLIEKIIQTYSDNIQLFLNSEETNITRILESLNRAAEEKLGDKTLNKLLILLEKALWNWDHVAQPVQLFYMTRGQTDQKSLNLFYKIRNFAIEFNNKHKLCVESLRIINLLGSVFAEVAQSAEKIKEDKSILQNNVRCYNGTIFSFDKTSQSWQERISCSYCYNNDANITISISPDGLKYKNDFWPLETIDRIYWGGIWENINKRQIIKYYIKWGTKGSSVTHKIEIYDEKIYHHIKNCLYETVGILSSIRMLNVLKNGNSIKYKNCEIFDTGIKFKNTNRSTGVFCDWQHVQRFVKNGSLYFESVAEPLYKAELQFLEDENTVLLELLTDSFFEREENNLSCLLGE